MRTIDLLPPDPTHAPEGPGRALLYPLWVIVLEIRPYPRAAPRTLRFSVDGHRNIPLPIRDVPETSPEPVAEDVRLVPAVPENVAIDTTRHFVKKGLGSLGGLIARISILETRKVWKLFWLTTGGDGKDALVDSRSGTVIPMPDDLPFED